MMLRRGRTSHVLSNICCALRLFANLVHSFAQSIYKRIKAAACAPVYRLSLDSTNCSIHGERANNRCMQVYAHISSSTHVALIRWCYCCPRRCVYELDSPTSVRKHYTSCINLHAPSNSALTMKCTHVV